MGFHDGERTMNRRNWTMRFALGTAVLAAVGMLGAPARADDKSAILYKQK